MIIKINNDTEYDFIEAKRENGQIVGTLTDGSEVILGGDIPGIDELFLNNRPAGIAAYVLAFLIAASRLYCYVHFPTDVLCGILLGTCVAIVLTPMLKRRFSSVCS